MTAPLTLASSILILVAVSVWCVVALQNQRTQARWAADHVKDHDRLLALVVALVARLRVLGLPSPEAASLLADLRSHMDPERYAEFIRNLERAEVDPEAATKSF